MQKKIIALAVAALASTAAFAQSNVTVYGVLDVSYQNIKFDGAKAQTAINSGFMSGSRLGFRGTEDLGNGLKALFTLEYGLTVDANTGVGAGTNARQQFVGLTGGFGTAVAGRLQTTGYDFTFAWLPGVSATGLDAYNLIGNTTLINASSRADNAVAYISPSFGGLTAAVNHARLTESRNSNVTGEDGTANLASLSYANGPLTAGLVYSQANLDQTAGKPDVKEVAVRAAYNFGVANVGFAWQNRDHSAANDKDSKWGLGVTVPVGNGVIAANYGRASIDTANNMDHKAIALGYIHNLSKRTNAYVGYRKTSGDSAYLEHRAFAAGIRHSF